MLEQELEETRGQRREVDSEPLDHNVHTRGGYRLLRVNVTAAHSTSGRGYRANEHSRSARGRFLTLRRVPNVQFLRVRSTIRVALRENRTARRWHGLRSSG